MLNTLHPQQTNTFLWKGEGGRRFLGSPDWRNAANPFRWLPAAFPALFILLLTSRYQTRCIFVVQQAELHLNLPHILRLAEDVVIFFLSLPRGETFPSRGRDLLVYSQNSKLKSNHWTSTVSSKYPQHWACLKMAVLTPKFSPKCLL